MPVQEILVQSDSKLFMACLATSVILLIMIVVFLRSKKRSYALAVVPLAIPSLMYLFSGVIARSVNNLLFFASSFQIRIVLDMLAALVACLLIGFASSFLEASKRTRALYCVCGGLFVLVYSGLLVLSSAAQLAVSFG